MATETGEETGRVHLALCLVTRSQPTFLLTCPYSHPSPSWGVFPSGLWLLSLHNGHVAAFQVTSWMPECTRQKCTGLLDERTFWGEADSPLGESSVRRAISAVDGAARGSEEQLGQAECEPLRAPEAAERFYPMKRGLC